MEAEFNMVVGDEIKSPNENCLIMGDGELRVAVVVRVRVELNNLSGDALWVPEKIWSDPDRQVPLAGFFQSAPPTCAFEGSFGGRRWRCP